MRKLIFIFALMLPMLGFAQSSIDYDNWIYTGEYTIPDGVRVIGDEAFMNCENLTSITIPESVEVIGESAFELCTNLQTVFIPKNVKEIKSCAFSSCDSLQGFEVDKDNPYFTTIKGVLFSHDKTKLVCCPNKNEYTIPSGTKTIGNYSFQGCKDMTSVTIPNSVEIIEEGAFSFCNGLTSITIPNSVKEIGSAAFWKSENLQTINLPNDIKKIARSTFKKCTNLTSITIPNSVAEIGDYAFQECGGLTTITIPGNVKTIGEYAFSKCNNLESITVEQGVEKIAYNAFMYCKNITSITIPINKKEFRSCFSFKDQDLSILVTSEKGLYFIDELVKVNRASCYLYKNIFERNLNTYGNYYGAQSILDDIKTFCTDKQSLDYALWLSLTASLYNKIGKFREALSLEKQAMNIYAQNKTLTPQKAPSLINMAYSSAMLSDYSSAKKYIGEAQKNFMNIEDPLAKFNDVYSLIYRLCSDLDSAIYYAKEAQTYYWDGDLSLEHANSLMNLAYCYRDRGDMQSAYDMLSEANTIYGNYDDDMLSAKKYQNNAEMLFYYGDFAGALDDAQRSLKLTAELIGTGNYDYAITTYNLANYELEAREYHDALEHYDKAALLVKQLLGTENNDYAKILLGKVEYYCRLGNYAKAIEICNALMVNMPANIWENKLLKADLYTKTAKCYSLLGNYAEAVHYANKALEITSDKKNNLVYVNALDITAQTYFRIGDYAKAEKTQSNALKIRENLTNSKTTVKYAENLSFLAKIKYNLSQLDSAIFYEGQALRIRKIIERNLAEYEELESKSNLAFYNSTFDPEESEKLEQEVYDGYTTNLPEGHPQIAKSLDNLAYYCFLQNRYGEAVKYAEKAIAARKALGGYQPDNATSLNNLASYNFKSGNYDESAKLYKQGFEHTKTFILKNFASMTEKERANFWSINSQFFSDEMPYATYKHPTPTFATLAYNGQLLSKGLLLNAELEVQKIIAQSSNKDLEKRYYSIRENRIRLDKLYQQPLSQRTLNTDSLLAIIEKDEKYLVERIKELGDYTRNLSIEWQDVQNKLSDKDVAIEFANFYDEDSKQEQYIAFVVKKGMSAPELVKLFSEDQLTTIKAYQTKNYNDSPTLYNLLWKPFEKYLNGVENIYFSPSGKLHTIAIEYLPDDSGEIFANKYNAYRLSSTRKLTIEHTVNHSKKVAAYGGIKYNLYVQDFENLKNSIADNNDVFRDFPLIAGSQKLPDGYIDLTNTKEEVETITESLKSAGYTVNAKYQKDATEESFKNLSGKGLQILHIATHGFYEEEKKLAKTNLSFFNKDNPNQEDRSLSCSGLAMAGANNTLDSVNFAKIPKGFDDGILTAKEISRLDFKGLDLVVLSACQTGVGKVTGEGVFGLQRGFKKAGANTILMSLWEVGDIATKELMIEFYKNLTNGKSKREAFIAAQELLRKKYKDPHYWAAFVMVDGVE